jgi:putative transposase
MRLSRAAYYRRPGSGQSRDGVLIEALNAVVETNPRWGFWKCYDRLRLDGHGWNHKRVRRVYRSLRLNLPRRTRKRVPARVRQSLEVIARPNEVWAMDFMSDALYRGRRFRTLNILDEGVREALQIVVDTSIPSGRVVRTLEQLRDWRGLPKAIRLDNGPEICAQVFVEWCASHGIELRYIQPGKPNQNAFIERFNRTYREEVLNAYLFETLDEVRAITEDWLRSYNNHRPHDALGRLPPSVFSERTMAPDFSTFQLST